MSFTISGTNGLTFPDTGLFQAAIGSLGSSGYQKLPNGLIIQWGSITLSGTSTVTGSFPTTFATPYTMVGAIQNQTNMPFSLIAISATQYQATGGAAGTPNLQWIAVGS